MLKGKPGREVPMARRVMATTWSGMRAEQANRVPKSITSADRKPSTASDTNKHSHPP